MSRATPIKVLVDGVEFPSIAKAAEHVGTDSQYLCRRLRAENNVRFKGYLIQNKVKRKPTCKPFKTKDRYELAQGEDHYCAKLTAEQVKWIREQYDQGKRCYLVWGRKCGVSGSTARAAAKRLTWKGL